MIYAEAFKDSCEKLCGLIKKGSFNPNQEQDIIDKMECLLNEYIDDNYKGKKLNVKIQPYQNQKLPDLNLYKIRKSKDFHKDVHCLFARFEIITDGKDENKLLKEYREFIKKIYNEFASTERRSLFIIDKTNILTDDDIEFLRRECQKTYRVKVYFCKATKLNFTN